MEGVDNFGVLNAGAEAVLTAAGDLFSEAVGYSDTVAAIRDSDGVLIATVTRAIDAIDLQMLLVYGLREYKRGQEAGQATAQANMRRALGIEP
jgi:hypothetical protein